MQLFLTLQQIKKLLLLFMVIYLANCQSVVSEKDLVLESVDIEKPVSVYEAKLYFSSAFGSMDLDVVTDLVEKSINISMKDPLDGSVKSLLRHKNKRWAFKDPKSDKDYYYISDANFLKYLYLDNILPNASFIVHLLNGTFPHQSKVVKKGDALIEVKGKNYIQNIHVKDAKPYLIEIMNEKKEVLALIEYSSKHIDAKDFYLPLFLNIVYKKHNLNFSISISNFKIK